MQCSKIPIIETYNICHGSISCPSYVPHLPDPIIPSKRGGAHAVSGETSVYEGEVGRGSRGDFLGTTANASGNLDLDPSGSANRR
jgi:hypothetical protein